MFACASERSRKLYRLEVLLDLVIPKDDPLGLPKEPSTAGVPWSRTPRTAHGAGASASGYSQLASGHEMSDNRAVRPTSQVWGEVMPASPGESGCDTGSNDGGGGANAYKAVRDDAEPGLQPRNPQAKACAPGCNIDATNSNTAPTWTNHPNALRPIESQQVQTNNATQFINVSDEMSPARRTYNPSTSAAGDTEAIAAKGRLVLINGATPTLLTQVTAYPSELFSHRNPTYNENTIALPTDRGALEISGTNLMYEGTRVKTWLIGRDLNPGGRGFGTYYGQGMFGIGQIRPAASVTPILGIGSSINNSSSGFESYYCSFSAGECRPSGTNGLEEICLMETCRERFDDPESMRACADQENQFAEKTYAKDPLRPTRTGWCFSPISGNCYEAGSNEQTITMFELRNKADERCAGGGLPGGECPVAGSKPRGKRGCGGGVGAVPGIPSINIPAPNLGELVQFPGMFAPPFYGVVGNGIYENRYSSGVMQAGGPPTYIRQNCCPQAIYDENPEYCAYFGAPPNVRCPHINDDDPSLEDTAGPYAHCRYFMPNLSSIAGPETKLLLCASHAQVTIRGSEYPAYDYCMFEWFRCVQRCIR